MTSPHIAHTVEDVRRLAPAKDRRTVRRRAPRAGHYWVRGDGKQEDWRRRHINAEWDVFRLFVEGGERFWEMKEASGDNHDDDWFIGCEIIGPIPEPGT